MVEDDNLAETLSNSIGYLLSQSFRLYRSRLTNVLQPLGLSLYEYGCLRLISLSVSMSQGDLGEKYGIDRTTMVGIVDQLEERGLVVREKNVSDRRSYRLLLTPKGNKVLSRAKRIVTKEQNKFLSPLNPRDWETIRTGLLKLISQNEKSESSQ